MSRRFLLALCMLLCLATTAVAHESLPQFARIDAALKSGAIDDDLALLYRFQYVFDGDKLPAEYQPDERTPIRCATPLIIEFNAVRSSLRADVVAAIDGYLAGSRPATSWSTTAPPGFSSCRT
ncbi:MAG: hypothetical protein IPH86_06750 [bacterium]|nr:hypothetical protein [bacterium]